MFRNLLIVIFLVCCPLVSKADRPDLVLQITVDQLRGDMLPRFADRFGEGGFRYVEQVGVLEDDSA